MARLQNSVLVEDVEYPQSYKPMTRSNYEFLADMVAPLMGWPSAIEAMANELQKNNPKFDRKKFTKRAVKAWENVNPLEPLDDHIPF